MEKEQIRIWHITIRWKRQSQYMKKDYILTAPSKEIAEDIINRRTFIGRGSDDLPAIRIRDLGIVKNEKTYFISDLQQDSVSGDQRDIERNRTIFRFTQLLGIEIGWRTIRANETEADKLILMKLRDNKDLQTYITEWADEYLVSRRMDPDDFFKEKLETFIGIPVETIEEQIPEVTTEYEKIIRNARNEAAAIKKAAADEAKQQIDQLASISALMQQIKNRISINENPAPESKPPEETEPEDFHEIQPEPKSQEGTPDSENIQQEEKDIQKDIPDTGSETDDPDITAEPEFLSNEPEFIPDDTDGTDSTPDTEDSESDGNGTDPEATNESENPETTDEPDGSEEYEEEYEDDSGYYDEDYDESGFPEEDFEEPDFGEEPPDDFFDLPPDSEETEPGIDDTEQTNADTEPEQGSVISSAKKAQQLTIVSVDSDELEKYITKPFLYVEGTQDGKSRQMNLLTYLIKFYHYQDERQKDLRSALIAKYITYCEPVDGKDPLQWLHDQCTHASMDDIMIE